MSLADIDTRKDKKMLRGENIPSFKVNFKFIQFNSKVEAEKKGKARKGGK